VTSKRVMAARLGPTSQREGGRSVFVCAPLKKNPFDQAHIDSVLASVIRPGDRLVTADATAGSQLDAVTAYGEAHGFAVSAITLETTSPDLIVLILDPLQDNTDILRARTLAVHGDSDIVLAELNSTLA